MKKIIASAGLVAVGAVSLNAQAQGLSPVESKPWSVSATLRGFYDDNYNTGPEHTTAAGFKAKDSWGFELSPSAALLLGQQGPTLARLEYIYSMKYYDNRPGNKLDHSHEFNGKVEHKFAENYKLSVGDSFVYTQEPEIVETVQTGPKLRERAKADAIRNRAVADFSARMTEKFSIDFAYQNTWYDYQENGDFSYSALLDRLEHLFVVQPHWRLQENMSAFVGYNYRISDFTDNGLISPNSTVRGKDRSNNRHDFYVGFDRELSPTLNGQVQVGAEYTTYDLGESDWGPYADLSLTYTYLPGSAATLGFRHARSATDVAYAVPGTTDITLDQEASTVYGRVTHRIAPNLNGSISGQYQHSTFNGGYYNDQVDDIFSAGLALTYKFTENWSTELGYNYDKLNSDIAERGFQRNRVWFGVRASF